MTNNRVLRRFSPAFPWLRALAFAIVAFAFAQSASLYPPLAAPGLAFGAAVLSLVAPSLAVVAIIIEIGLPLLAADFAVGVAFLVLGFASLQYVGQEDAKVFLVIALSFLGATMGVPWAVLVVAGYVMGASEGAVAAGLACLTVETAGILLGREALGAVVTGGGKATLLVDLGRPLEDPFAFKWVSDSIAVADPGKVVSRLSSAKNLPLLVVQPLLWGACAALAGALRRRADDRVRVPFAAVAAIIAALAAGLATFAAAKVVGAVVPAPAFTPVLLSAAAALAALLAWEVVFEPHVVETVEPPRSSMRADDADVDELLSVIASAEDALAARHTSERTVMITDMKSFSKMTEEQGSVVTAKMIQRHRDLLLPLIVKHGGAGKSTGGDGLLAAFTSPDGAVAAAVEMQRALDEFNRSRRVEQEMQIRIGVASGEVVLDKGGKPFIGDGLNLAARVMGLADGGQVFVTGDVIEAAKQGFRSVALGAYELKNISRPIPIHEVLWREGQESRAPQLADTG